MEQTGCALKNRHWSCFQPIPDPLRNEKTIEKRKTATHPGTGVDCYGALRSIHESLEPTVRGMGGRDGCGSSKVQLDGPTGVGMFLVVRWLNLWEGLVERTA